MHTCYHLIAGVRDHTLLHAVHVCDWINAKEQTIYEKNN